ncbi:hypothetical protein KU6B_18450 [Mameliella alba]|nr:hypothetical protein KU6B_18450 [Mameliella alba]
MGGFLCQSRQHAGSRPDRGLARLALAQAGAGRAAGIGQDPPGPCLGSAVGARIVKARDLTPETIPALAGGPVCVEDIEEIAGDRPAEEMLFHLHNLVLANGGTLMVTATRAPAHWPLVLPDLASRMMHAQLAQISEPDDSLLAALLAKLFADRQLLPSPEVLSYLVRHMPRSYATAARLVAALDAEALAHQRDITRPMAARVLSRLVPPGAEDRGTSRHDPGGAQD